MKSLAVLAASVCLTGGSASAAVLDLDYTLFTQLVSYTGAEPDPLDVESGLDLQPGDPYTRTFSLSFDTSADLPLRDFSDTNRQTYIDRFDRSTGAVEFVRVTALDIVEEYDLRADGTGTFRLSGTNPFAGGISTYVFDVVDYDVEGLTNLAPVPLPASMPLLALALGGLACAWRRQAA